MQIFLDNNHVSHPLFLMFAFRTMAVSLTMMVGRVGAVIGNLLFPVLFSLSCLGPFFMIGTASLGKLSIITFT